MNVLNTPAMGVLFLDILCICLYHKKRHGVDNAHEGLPNFEF